MPAEAEQVGLMAHGLAGLNPLHAQSMQALAAGFDSRPAPGHCRPTHTLDDQLYNTAYRITGDAALAHDVYTQVLQQVARMPARKWRHRRKVWLMHTLIGACRKLQPSQPFRPPLSAGRRQRLPAASPGPGSGAPTANATNSPQHPITLVQAGLEMLPFELRATVVLSDLVGFNYQQIADATGVSVKTVRSRLSRGRIALRDTLFGTPPSK